MAWSRNARRDGSSGQAATDHTRVLGGPVAEHLVAQQRRGAGGDGSRRRSTVSLRAATTTVTCMLGRCGGRDRWRWAWSDPWAGGEQRGVSSDVRIVGSAAVPAGEGTL